METTALQAEAQTSRLPGLRIVHAVVVELRDLQTIRFYAYLAVCFAAFILFKRFVLLPASSEGHMLPLGFAALASIAGLKVRMDSAPPVVRIVLRLVLGFFGLYLLTAFPTFLYDSLTPGQAMMVEYGRYIAVGAAFGVYAFPSLALFCLTYVLWYKGIFSMILGMSISSTDYIPLIEVSTFLTLSVLFWRPVTMLPFMRPLGAPEEPEEETSLLPLEKVFLFGLAIHMANYFFSGLKKIQIGDHFYSWVINNNTGNLILNALALGQFPLSFSHFLSRMTYEGFEAILLPSNFLIFVGQLFAIVALTRIRWAFWATLFYDVTHVVIFICSGIFFYKWILLNTSVVLGLKTIRHKKVSPVLAISLVAAVLCAPTIFFVAKLGWWDTPALNVERFYVVTRDGKTTPVPTNFWGSFSVRMAQQRMLWDKSDGFFPTGTYAITLNQREMEAACNHAFILDDAAGDTVIDAYFAKKGNNLTRFVQNYHKWALTHRGGRPNWLYDLYPHHIFSMPWEYNDFRNLDLKNVVAYRYSIKSTYLGYKDGQFTRQVVREDHHDIPVGQ